MTLEPVESTADGNPPATSSPPAWTRTLTHLVALGWGTCELALWGGRPPAFMFIGMVLMGTEGVRAAAKVRDLLR